MDIASVTVDGFRNLAGTLPAAPGLNVLWGDNGQGKTNWLEAVYLLATTKSFRTHQPQEVIAFGATAAHLRAEIVRRSTPVTLDIHLEGGRKTLFVNGKRVALNEYLGQLTVFAYGREALSVICGEPGERRRFLDRGVLSLKPAYVQTLADYNRVLKQKNALLRAAAVAPDRCGWLDSLEDWNAQLVELGTRLHVERAQYAALLNEHLDWTIFNAERITIRYVSALDPDVSATSAAEAVREALAERLVRRREAELAAGHALVGPHRDDLAILVDGREVARFGSAGQQRSALLVLTLGQLALYREHCAEPPVFLLDDLDAELDVGRITALLEYLQDKAQTFVTTTKPELVHAPACWRQVRAGRCIAAQDEGLHTFEGMCGSGMGVTADGNYSRSSAAERNFEKPLP
ncbi:MAG: DNA replication and repair protein RecF [Chloracidobacterium sp.]|nr:DNA replication and repair protein RecF [Chloracidobacterium sp.]MDW8216714.1 DNA replication and repair protein RecF [Acidobacteriota bacterium]